jgi:hypothetical protein
MAEIRLRDEDVTWRSVDDEVIVLDRRSWAYLSVNGSGALLWPRVVDGTTRPDLVEALVAAYAIEPDNAAADVDAFVGMLREHDLLQV